MSPIKGKPDGKGRLEPLLCRLGFEYSRDIILFVNRQDGRILEANTAAVQAYGYAYEELLTLTIHDLRAPETQRFTEDQMARADGEGILFETVHRCKDGTSFPAEVNSRGVTIESSRILISVVRDITERKKAERSLREREEASRRDLAQMRSVLNIMSEGLLIVDGQGRILHVNPAMIQLAGWQEAPRETWREYIDRIEMRETSGELLPPHRWPVSRALRGESMRDLEYKVRRFDTGKEYVALYSGTPVLNQEGKVELVVVTVRDITARKRDEEELRIAKQELEQRVRERTAELESRNKELQDFAFVASHDLQEPLRKIQMFGEILGRNRDRLDAQGLDSLHRMLDGARRMGTLLSALLDYSRVTTKTEDFQPVDLNEVAGEAISNVEYWVRKNDGRIQVEPLPVLESDRSQMVRLFQNLLSNGLKYRKPDLPPVVRVSCTGAGEVCELEFEDNGIGFEERYLDRIFRPFERLHGKSGAYTGVGMGLAICKKIVDRHGGNITAKSVPGKGSTFIVRLPAIQPLQNQGRTAF
jgi:PAS domain S-box-containing protein